MDPIYGHYKVIGPLGPESDALMTDEDARAMGPRWHRIHPAGGCDYCAKAEGR